MLLLFSMEKFLKITIKKKWYREGDQDDRVALPPQNINNKSILNFSWKTTWKLADEHLYNQSYKKNLYVTWKDRRKKDISLGHVPLRRICKEERVCMGGPHPREWAGGITIWASQSWGAAQRRQVPLPAGKTTRTDRRAVEAQTVLSRSAHMLTG